MLFQSSDPAFSLAPWLLHQLRCSDPGFGLSTILTTAAAKVDSRAELAYATASQTTTEAVTNIRTVRALRAEVGMDFMELSNKSWGFHGISMS